jgi:hypothetical protein
MVRNKNENNADSIPKTEPGQGAGRRDQHSRDRANNRGRSRGRQQNMAKNDERGKDVQGTSTAGPQKGPRSHDAYSRDNSRQRGYYRDKGKGTDRNHQQKYSGGRYGNTHKSKEEETIEDIKRDILRIEKEIELEIREIRSMKFL